MATPSFTMLQTQIIKDIIKAYSQEDSEIDGERITKFIADIGYHFDKSTARSISNNQIRDSYIVVHDMTGDHMEFRPWDC